MCFQENCNNRKELLETVNQVVDRNRMVAFWQKRSIDNRQMITEQLKATSMIISGLTYEIKKTEDVDQELSER